MTRTLLWITTAAAALAATPALAQSTSAPGVEPTASPDVGDGQSEDVVVTALKREQTLIDVPQSVSVVSGESLERQQAFTFQDYAKLVPGLQIAQSNPGEGRVVLRGINTGGVAATVATYVDETPFGSSTGQANGAILAGEVDTFDMARIEVLRGPQGTLYGASSLGGVIKFVSATPDTTKIEGRARGSVEGTDGGEMSYNGSAMLNVPLSSTLAVRASGFYRRYGGFIDSDGLLGADVAKNINGTDSYGGRISALWKPIDALSIRLTAILQDLNSDAGSVVESDPVSLLTRRGYVQSQYVPEYTDVRYRVYNGTGDLDLGFATVTSSTSYSTLKVALRDDLTVLYGGLLGVFDPATGPLVDIGLVQQTNTERFTQEVRIASAKSDVFEWLVGGYYNHEKGAILQRIDVYDQGTLTISDVLPPLADIFSRSRYEEFAGFANGTLHLGRVFDLDFGGRYSHNDQDANQGGTGLLAPPELSSESSEGVFTWSVAPKVKFGNHASLYARVAKGFRPGGPNIVPPSAPDSVKTYRSDSLVSYELGFKMETADRTFSLDASVFHIDWSDIQLFAQVEDFGVNANGGKAESNGVEFTATARPTRGLAVSVNGAYTDAKLREDTDPLINGRDGDRLPFTPQWAASVNGDYDWQVGAATTAFVGSSLRFVGEQAGPFSTEAVLAGRTYKIPSYAVFDLRAGLDFGRFSVEAYAKNLSNADGKTNVTGEGNFPFGAVGTGVIRPRSYGLTLGASF